MNDIPRRIHITGGPGGGKTTLAGRLSRHLDLPVLDLDGAALSFMAQMPRPIDHPALIRTREAHIAEFVQQPSWISDGVFMGFERRLYHEADLIVWLDVPWRTASTRILLRHFKANLAGNNRFPGVGNLYTFWRWCSRYYADRNPHGLNDWGAPATRAYLLECLKPHADKLRVCRTNTDVEQLITTLTKTRPETLS